MRDCTGGRASHARSNEQALADFAAADLVRFASELNQHIRETADILAEFAEAHCQASQVDSDNCSWYHGSWSYLRLMDLVSAPTWHHAFYSKNLAASLKAGHHRAVVTGTADFSTPAYILEAGVDLEGCLQVNVVDRCPTPLYASTLLAKRLGRTLGTTMSDVREFSLARPSEFDLICTDAFLSRFSAVEQTEVLEAWNRLLVPSGRVLTTVRLSSRPASDRMPHLAQSFGRRAYSGWEFFESDLRPSCKEMAAKAETYALRMRTNPLLTESAAIDLFERKFNLHSWEVAEVPGELTETKYARVVLEKR